MTKIAIIGSRSINDLKLLENIYDRIGLSYLDCDIMSGGEEGIDKNAIEFAKKYNLNYTIFYPEWKKYGKRSFFKRNEYIVKNCDICIAIWDGISKGTKHIIELCKTYFKRLYVWNNSPNQKILYIYKYDNVSLDIF